MRCPECASPRVEMGKTEWTCQACGLVIEDCVLDDTTYEKRAPAQQPRLAQAGTQQLSGRIVKQHWLYSHKEKKKLHISRELHHLGEQLEVSPLIVQEAQYIVHKLQDTKQLSGRNPKAILVASLYMSCLLHGVAKTHLDMELATGVNRFVVLQYQKIVCKLLSIPHQRVAVEELIHTYVNKLGIKPIYGFIAIEIYDKRLTQSAYIIASALLYKACEGRVTQSEIAFVSGVHEATMRRTLKLLSN